MFALIFSLYYAMFVGEWHLFTLNEVLTYIRTTFNACGELLTSVFGDVQMLNFGDSIYNFYPEFISIVLATITSIGIVVLAVKGVKRIFGVFFYGVR